MWTEIAKHLYGYDLVSLSLTCRWFRRLLVDDSIWRHAFIRDLKLPATLVPPPGPLHRSWRRLYAAAFGNHQPAPPAVNLLPLTSVPLTDMCALPFADGSHSYCYHQMQRHIGKRNDVVGVID